MASLESKLADAGISKDEVEGVEIGVPDRLKMTASYVNVSISDGVHSMWQRRFSEKIGLPVKVGDD